MINPVSALPGATITQLENEKSNRYLILEASDLVPNYSDWDKLDMLLSIYSLNNQIQQLHGPVGLLIQPL